MLAIFQSGNQKCVLRYINTKLTMVWAAGEDLFGASNLLSTSSVDSGERA